MVRTGLNTIILICLITQNDQKSSLESEHILESEFVLLKDMLKNTKK